jgi:phosphoglycerate-specific signal transduction histidine kinase
VRSTIIASLLVVLAAGALAACGQSKADKARDQVCQARDSIGHQIESLQELTLTTATTEKVQDSLQAIQSDLKTIASASDDLAADRKKDVQAANDEFTAKMAQIGQDFGNSLSIQGAATQAKAALQQLAQSYRSTFGQLDCS